MVSVDRALANPSLVRPPSLPAGFKQRPEPGAVGPTDRYQNDGRTQPNPNPTDVSVAISPERRDELEHDLNFQFKPGRHTADSPVLGSRAEEMDAVRAAAAENPELLAFTNALYDGNIYMIPPELEKPASRAALESFGQYVAAYNAPGLTPNNAVQWSDHDMTRTFIYDKENEGNTWRIHAMVGRFPPTNDAGMLLPRGIAAKHELMHVELTRQGEPEHSSGSDPLAELLPTVMTIIDADTLRKQLTGQPLDATIDYGRNVEWSGNSVPLGTLANRMRELVDRYGNYGDAMSTPGALNFLVNGDMLSGTRQHHT